MSGIAQKMCEGIHKTTDQWTPTLGRNHRENTVSLWTTPSGLSDRLGTIKTTPRSAGTLTRGLTESTPDEPRSTNG